MGKRTKLQFVWPKDGYKGCGHRGFFKRLNDILTGRGPDIFLDKEKSSAPIKVDFWANWDSYHDHNSHRDEVTGSFNCKPWNTSRGTRRYDPHSRRYKKWHIPEDWLGYRVGPMWNANYPRFTEEEGVRMLRQLSTGLVDPRTMGKDWHDEGPRRFNYEHDWFWQEAHRAGENMRMGFSPHAGINPFLRMHQCWPDDLDRWILAEL